MTKQNDIAPRGAQKDHLLVKARQGLSGPWRLRQKVVSLRTKLTVLTLALIALITGGTAITVMQNMDQMLQHALVDRGTSLTLSAGIPAGYSILAKDRLALDNLASKITASQDDILYLAIVDMDGDVLAHSQLEETGSRFIKAPGAPVAEGDGFTMYQVSRNGYHAYEFQAPIKFAQNQVGTVIVGIDSATMTAAKALVRNRIILIALGVMLFGGLGTFLLSRRFTAPIERLAVGVSQVTSGDYSTRVKVTSRDELGELTLSFNKMSRMIRSQKRRLENYAGNLEEAYTATVRILAAALDARDNYTFGHSARVARLALLIGERLDLSREELKDLEMACLLHDIGKIHVPDRILNKPTPLDNEEFHVIKKHPQQGAEILGLAESLHKYVPVVQHHHEWFNGNGYPSGLKGDEINLFAQIVAIADCYDAMTSSRPYRKGCGRDQAVAEIVAFSGRQFNPELVDTFLAALSEFATDQLLFSPGDLYASHDYSFSNYPAVTSSAQCMHISAASDREYEEFARFRNPH